MNNDVSFTLEALRNSKSRPAKMALGMVNHLRQELSRLETQGATKAQRAKIRQAAFDAIQADLAEANGQEIARARQDLDRLRVLHEREYLKNAQANDRAVQAAQRKYAAMTETELRQEKEKVLAGKYPAQTDPAVYDELAIALKYVGDTDGQDDLRAFLTQRRYDEPWTHTPTGATIADELKALEQAGSNVVVQHENRFFAVSALDLEAFFKEESEDQGDEDAAL